jgi:large subunit ribosomal protein L32
MPQEPKKRHSRQRQGKRRHAIKLSVAKTILCKNCGKSVKAHIVCRHCGYYKGKEIINVNARKEKREAKRKEEENKA